MLQGAEIPCFQTCKQELVTSTRRYSHVIACQSMSGVAQLLACGMCRPTTSLDTVGWHSKPFQIGACLEQIIEADPLHEIHSHQLLASLPHDSKFALARTCERMHCMLWWCEAPEALFSTSYCLSSQASSHCRDLSEGVVTEVLKAERHGA